MKIFDIAHSSNTRSFSSEKQTSVSSNGTPKKTKRRPSDAEIRAKIQKHNQDKAIPEENRDVKVELSNTAINIKKTGEKDEGDVVIGDIGKNDPNTPQTRVKLKELLGTGGFRFNPKEREVLSKILAED